MRTLWSRHFYPYIPDERTQAEFQRLVQGRRASKVTSYHKHFSLRVSGSHHILVSFNYCMEVYGSLVRRSYGKRFYPICSVSQQGGHLDDNCNPFVGDLQRKEGKIGKARSEKILYFSTYYPHCFNILCLKVLKD